MTARSLLLSLALLVPACAPEPAAEGEDDGVADTSGLSEQSLVIPRMPESVSFCTGGSDFHLPNAAWLAWFSANSYTHLKVLAPALEAQGFGHPGDAEAWLADYRALKAAEESKVEDFGRVEQRFIQTVHLDRGIDFFSGGKAIESEDSKNPLKWWFKKGSTQVTFAHHGTQPFAVIAFRGTERDEDRDISADLNIFKVDSPLGGAMHRGFARAEAQVEALLEERLRALPPKTTVFLTGHSLGGGLATVFLTKAMTWGLDLHYELYTFGSPRVGNGTFARKFDEKAKELSIPLGRFTNDKDPVPGLPPSFFSYEHIGTPMVIIEQTLTVGGKRPKTILGRKKDHRSAEYWEKITNGAILQETPFEVGGVNEWATVTRDELMTCSATVAPVQTSPAQQQQQQQPQQQQAD